MGVLRCSLQVDLHGPSSPVLKDLITYADVLHSVLETVMSMCAVPEAQLCVMVESGIGHLSLPFGLFSRQRECAGTKMLLLGMLMIHRSPPMPL